MKNKYYILLVAVCALLFIKSKAQTNTVTYTADNTTSFPNPERGFFLASNPPWPNDGSTKDQWEATEKSWTAPLDEAALKNDRVNRGITLRAMRYHIAMFRNTGLSQKFLDRVNADFATARRAGVKLNVSFVYAWLGPRPDAPKSTILAHLDQLKPLLDKNKDVLAYMDGGFVGHYGEWHHSSNGLLTGQWGTGIGADATEILNKIFASVPASRMFTFRYVDQKSTYFDPSFESREGKSIWYNFNPVPSLSDAFSTTIRGRAGNSNGSFLQNYYHGSYGYESSDASLIPNIKTKVGNENKYAVQTGELDYGLTGTREYCICNNALREFKLIRFSAFNLKDGQSEDYNQVHPVWRNGGCFNEIERKLGYRYRMIESTVPTTIRIGEELKMSVKITNDGWASCYNPRQVEIILRNKQSGQKIVLSDNGKPSSREEDPRFWLPGETHTLTIDKYNIPAGTVTGDYEVLLNLPDPMPSIHDRPEYAIRMANQNTWESTTGYNKLLQTITIKPVVTTGIAVTGSNENIELYPNPANKEVTINYTSSNAKKAEIIISDMLSRIVKKQAVQLQTGTNEIKVDVSNLEKGLYTIQFVSSDKEIITKKLLINN